MPGKEDPQTLKNLLLALTSWRWKKRDFFAIAQEERLSCPASSATSRGSRAWPEVFFSNFQVRLGLLPEAIVESHADEKSFILNIPIRADHRYFVLCRDLNQSATRRPFHNPSSGALSQSTCLAVQAPLYVC
jgi:hypothetical protein